MICRIDLESVMMQLIKAQPGADQAGGIRHIVDQAALREKQCSFGFSVQGTAAPHNSGFRKNLVALVNASLADIQDQAQRNEQTGMLSVPFHAVSFDIIID
jgi:hypothetical protein